jgi:alpha-D-ribose 1-methylphosphonate 5-triphosphate synthase subunit PhnH
MNNLDLTKMQAGFEDVTHASQGIFRHVMQAISRPDSIQELPNYLSHTNFGQAGSLQLLLALLDAQTYLYASRGLIQAGFIDYLRFHTACQLTDDLASAQFVWLDSNDQIPSLADFQLGTDEYPDAGASLFLDVSNITLGSGALRIKGPGIAAPVQVDVVGLAQNFWQQRQAQQLLFPRGIDIFLSAQNRLLGIPRSTQVDF